MPEGKKRRPEGGADCDPVPSQRRKWSDKQIIDGALTSLASGQSLLGFCKANGLPYASTWELLNPSSGDNSAYVRAREIGTHYLNDECLEIADGVLEQAKSIFQEQLKTAKEYAGVDPALLDHMAARPPDISELIAVAKVKIDTRRRLTGVWNPRDYSEKHQIIGDAANPVRVVQRIETVIVDVDPANTEG